MSKPIIAIVGRPNVGKSTLFNRLVGKRTAIVEDVPGVTRDRQYGDGEVLGREFLAIDTGGFDPAAEDKLLAAMRDQAEIAMAEADVIVAIFDGKAGLTPADREITRLLNRGAKPVHYAVNKIDGFRHEPLVAEFWELGVDMLWPISAQHGAGVLDLFEAVAATLPEPRQGQQEVGEDVIKVAVVGKPNAGKSTLLNQLLGEERLLVSDVPGTTRDSIDTWLEVEAADEGSPARRYLMIDTAGVRRRKWIKSAVEKISVVRTFKSIDRADVCLLLIDATEGVTDQDAKIARLIADKGRGCVILLNKWDAVPDKSDRTIGEAVRDVRASLGFISWAPILSISAKTGQRAHKIMGLVDATEANRRRRISTGELNRFLDDLVQTHQPPIHNNRRVKLYYGSQVGVRPPTFLLWVSQPDGFPAAYRRFILNRLRARWDFEGTPVKLATRKRESKARESDEQPRVGALMPED